FGPDYTAGCPSCSAIADGFNGFVVHLENHDVTFSAVSRAPLAKLQAYKRRMEWTFPWASALGSDFNFDFNVSITEEQQREGGVEYNYRTGYLTTHGFRASFPASVFWHPSAALRCQRGGNDRLVRVHVDDGRDADARRLDDVDGVDADARTDVARRGGVVPWHVGRDD